MLLKSLRKDEQMISKVSLINFKSGEPVKSNNPIFEKYKNTLKNDKVGAALLTGMTLVGVPATFMAKTPLRKIQGGIVGFGALLTLVLFPLIKKEKSDSENKQKINEVV